MVVVLDPGGREVSTMSKIKISISLDADVLEYIDGLAEGMDAKRSALINSVFKQLKKMEEEENGEKRNERKAAL